MGGALVPDWDLLALGLGDGGDLLGLVVVEVVGWQNLGWRDLLYQ